MGLSPVNVRMGSVLMRGLAVSVALHKYIRGSRDTTGPREHGGEKWKNYSKVILHIFLSSSTVCPSN